MKTENPAGLSDLAIATLAKAGINPLGYVRVNELKPKLGVPHAVSTTWKLVAAGEFPAPLRLGGITCWLVADVVAWLERQASTAATGDGRGARLTAARQAKCSPKA